MGNKKLSALDFFEKKTGIKVEQPNNIGTLYSPIGVIKFMNEYHEYMSESNTQPEITKEPSVLHGVMPRINWDSMRNEFFEECTTETPRDKRGKKVNIAPHDLFEWFKCKILKYVE